jgi:hypothetical protein
MILQYLDVSTSHVTRDTMQLLSWGTLPLGMPAMTVASYEYGAFVSVPEELALASPEGQALPADLLEVLQAARTLGCDVVRLDADGAQMDALPTYLW